MGLSSYWRSSESVLGRGMGDNGCEGLISRVEVGTAGSGWGSVSGTSTLGVQVVGGARNGGGASFAEGR